MTDADAITPMLRFKPHDGEEKLEVGWTGAWPPPTRFLVLVGRESGIVKLWPDEGELIPEKVRAAIAHPTIEASWYTRSSFSKFSDDEIAALNDRAGRPVLMRGAEYEFEERAEEWAVDLAQE